MEEITNQQKPDSPQVKEVKVDLKRAAALEAVANSEGGQIILDSIRRDITDDIETVMSLFKGAEMDLRCAVAKLKGDLALYRILKRAPEGAKLTRDELSRLLEEEDKKEV